MPEDTTLDAFVESDGATDEEGVEERTKEDEPEGPTQAEEATEPADGEVAERPMVGEGTEGPTNGGHTAEPTGGEAANSTTEVGGIEPEPGRQAADPTESETDSVDTGPAVIDATMVWRPDGEECTSCGSSSRRLWQDGGTLVCPDCKNWSRA